MSQAIHFTRVDVRQMPGFPQGGLSIDGIVEGINVIYGPNASGKTTLSRAMQRLLQPSIHRHHTDSISAELVVGGKSFELDYHLGQIACRSAGRDVTAPALAPAEVGQRYVLALHDLIQEDDGDIVQQILQEAAGGYDLASAARNEGFNRDKPSGRNNKTVRDYEESVRDRKAAEERLISIERSAQRLAELERQRCEAHAALLRQHVIEDVLDAKEKDEQLLQAKRALMVFPEGMSKLVGNERSRLIALQDKLTGLRNKLTRERRLLGEAKQELVATALPEEGVSARSVHGLQARSDTLRDRATDISRLRREVVGAQETLSGALKRLGPEVSPIRAATVDGALLEKLLKFIRQSEEQWLDAKASERVTDWLTSVPAESQSLETLREGIVLLQQWLGEERISPLRANEKWEWIIAALMTVVVSLLMMFVHPSWLWLLILAGVLLAWAFLRPFLSTSPTAAQEIPNQWIGLGLTPPSTWTPVDVQATIRRLQQEWAASQLALEKSMRFADLQKRQQTYHGRQQQIDKVRQAWRSRLGIEIDIDDARLYLLAGALRDAQVARTRVNAVHAELTEAQRQHGQLLAKINTEVTLFVNATAADDSEASSLIRDLVQRREDFSRAKDRRDHAKHSIQEYANEIKDLESNRATLFMDLDLTLDDELTLRQWTDQFTHYQQAVKGCRLAQHDASKALAKIDDHKNLFEQTDEELRTELDKCGRLAKTLTSVDEKVGDIRGRVDRAKGENSLEIAIAREESCRDELRVLRDKDAAQLIGNVLVTYLTRQHRDAQQPGVLTHAVGLFARITHGRYRLLVAPGDPPRFRALDTSLGREQNLDELSSGTRLQLLLSVRVAFVEQQERGLQLPLIFDETLGNSDERRARKIIESVVELARGGRQVFYFTAQHDELGKWRRALREAHDVTHRELDLARLRGFSEDEHAPELLEFEPPQSLAIPAPKEDDWIEYGRRLNVPQLDRGVNVGGIHLWYVIDDVNELHRLLVHDINKWGQLQTLVDIGSAEGLNRESIVLRRAAAAARLLEHVLRFWHQGRGKPVERTALEASGAVSEAFIDEASQLALCHDGDARRLIENLRDGQVRRFRTGQIDALETYFVECGYLDDRPILNTAQIREAVTPLVFADCESGLLSRDRINQLVALVTQEAVQEPSTLDGH